MSEASIDPVPSAHDPPPNRLARFICMMVFMTIVFTILWEVLLTDRVYHCTDEIGFNYLMPGSWVHGELQTVPEITGGLTPMGPDTIKEGWTVPGLWALWFAGVGFSAAVSGLVARGRRPASHID